MQKVNLRSDTVTLPTPEMMDAILHAELGDDVTQDDPTVNRLEAYAADYFGKEAALLVSSGTMGNLVAVLAQTGCRRPEIIAEEHSHIIVWEGGSYSHFGGVATRTITGEQETGVLDPDKVEAAIRDDSNLHYPRTCLICMENTHNWSGGTVVTVDQIKAVRAVADRHGIPMHLDGARVFNAAIALGVPVRAITDEFTTAQICLSKGLSAPMGSVVVGPKAVIDEARHMRKMLGGGLRQAGIIAAAGLVALEKMTDRLAEDHAHARALAEGLAKIDGIRIDLHSVQSNMVRIEVDALGMTGQQFVDGIAAYGILAGTTPAINRVRFVTHRHITDADVARAIDACAAVAEAARKR